MDPLLDVFKWDINLNDWGEVAEDVHVAQGHFNVFVTGGKCCDERGANCEGCLELTVDFKTRKEDAIPTIEFQVTILENKKIIFTKRVNEGEISKLIPLEASSSGEIVFVLQIIKLSIT